MRTNALACNVNLVKVRWRGHREWRSTMQVRSSKAIRLVAPQDDHGDLEHESEEEGDGGGHQKGGADSSSLA